MRNPETQKQRAKALINTEFRNHFHAFASVAFCDAACPPARAIIPSHEEGTEIIVEYLEDKGLLSAYFITCREPGQEIIESFISLCGMDRTQPAILVQFDTFTEYLDYCVRTSQV